MKLINFLKANWLFIAIIFLAAFLRLYKLSEVPVSLFGDELDVGYHAYSILKTGKDYYGNFMPLHFHSIAEWRTPLYLYSTVPTVALFGISPLGVRLPAALFGILGVLIFYKLVELIRKDYLKVNGRGLEIIAAFLLAVSPWHIQYSRAGFEVTQLLFFLLLGIYFFLKTLRSEENAKGRLLWLSMAAFALTPWIYSTAKLFTPMLLAFLFVLFHKTILGISKKYLAFSLIALTLIGAPMVYSTLFGGGSQRFSYISVFSDPTVEHEIGTARELEARVRGERGDGINPSMKERVFNNKFTLWGESIENHYLESTSFNFLFANGDLNPRHSIEGMGQFYKIEVLALLAGIIFFFGSKIDKKLKLLTIFWVIGGILPAALTRDGGGHASRLILILPPLVFLNAYGVFALANYLNRNLRVLFIASYGMVFLTLFLGYQNTYWVHNPWQSERWWHYGWSEAVAAVREEEKNYDKVIISTADEPPWIFFAANYPYPPAQWQANFPLDHKTVLADFGEVSYIDKFYFASPEAGVYDWARILDNKTLYLASAKEVGPNLIREPERTPGDLLLIKSIAFPSGEPAFYLFTGKGGR